MDTVSNSEQLNSDRAADTKTSSSFSILRGGYLKATAFVAAFAAAYVVPAFGLLRGPGPTYEEGIVLFGADLVARGQVPHRDFFSIYGPMSTWVPGQIFRVLGPSTVAVRVLGVLVLGGRMMGIYRLAVALRPSDTWTPIVEMVGASVVLLSAQVVGPEAWWWGLMLTVWSAVIALRVDSAPRLAFTAAVLAALTSGFRPDLVPLAFLLVASATWRNWSVLKVPLLSGAFVGSIPILIHTAVAGFGTTFDSLVTTPVIRLRSFRNLPIPPPFDHFDSSVMNLMSSGTKGVFRLAVPAQFASWFWLLVLAPALLFISFAYQRRSSVDRIQDRRSTTSAWRWFADLAPARRQWLLLSFGLLPQLLQRADFAHMVLVGVVLVPALMLAIAELVPERAAALAAAAVIVVLSILVSPALVGSRYFDVLRFRPAQTAAEVRTTDREFFVASSGQADSFATVIEVLDRESNPGDTVIVAPADLPRSVLNDMVLYFLLPSLTPGTYFSEINPGITNRPDSGFREDLRKTDWLVLTHFADGFREPNRSNEILDPQLLRIVEETFCLVEEKDPFVEILRLCE